MSRRPLEVPSHAEAEEAAEEAEKEELLLGCILADAAEQQLLLLRLVRRLLRLRVGRHFQRTPRHAPNVVLSE